MGRSVLAFMAAGLAGLGSAQAQPSDPLGLAWLETPDLRLVYPRPQLDHLTAHTVRTYTASLRWQRVRFGWQPSDKPTVLLKDFTDFGNARAGTSPGNLLQIDVAPSPNTFDTNPSAERMASLMNHELVHIANGDVANSQDRFWRQLLRGKVVAQSENPESLVYSALTVPRFTVPRWLLEGAAVFMETWMGGGLGRAQGGYDEMVFRSMVRDGTTFYDPLGLATRGIRSDFQAGANAYLYGTRFFTWLAHAHTPEKVVTWLRRDEGSLRHYAAAFEQVFGLTLTAAWAQWVDFEHTFQRENLSAVRRVPATPLQPLVPQALGSSSRTFLDAERQVLYGAFRQTGGAPYLGALHLRDGRMQVLTNIQGGMLYAVSALAYDPVQQRLFYTARNHHRRDLVVFDLKSGQQTVLQKEARIGELVFNRADSSLLGVRVSAGLATLVRLPPPYDDWQPLHTFDYGVVPSDLDVSPDGQQLSATVSVAQGGSFLRVWSLPDLVQEPGRLRTLAETHFGQAAPEGFVFTPDGRALVGSSYYTGVSNIFRFEPASGVTTAVSNAETGLFRPLPRSDGSLIVLTYTGQGLLPAVMQPQPLTDLGTVRFLGTEVANRHPVVKTWQVDAPSTVDDAALVQHRGIYRPLEHLRLDNAYPVVLGYKDTAALGYRLNFSDGLGYAEASTSVAWSPSTRLPAAERLHIDAKARYLSWRARLAWNPADFYDLFGPTQRSRKGALASLGYDHSLIYDTPRTLDLKLDLTRYTGIDTLPDAQNVQTAARTLTHAEVALKYRNLGRSLGAVDDEKGVAAQAALSLQHAGGHTTPQAQASADVGWALPWAHASLWSRTALGASPGDDRNGLGRFYFGGFGNNRVDHGLAQRYREPLSLPGFPINGVSGRHFVKQQAELVLPRVLFESVGRPDLNLTWLQPQLFASALWTDPGRAQARRWASVGGQLDFRLGVWHWHQMVLSAGWAAGYDGRRRAGHEWMLSLKLM